MFAVRQPSSRLHCGVHELLGVEGHIYLDIQVREGLFLKVSRKSRSLALARVQVLLAKLPVLQRHVMTFTHQSSVFGYNSILGVSFKRIIS